MKKAQFSAIELVLLILLFAFSSSYYIKPIPSTNQDYKTSIESALDSIYYSEDFREIIMNENIDVSYITEDWSPLNTTLSNILYDFEIQISDTSTTKTIYECTSTNYSTKHIAQRIITIKDDNTFEFRTISLGGCY